MGRSRPFRKASEGADRLRITFRYRRYHIEILKLKNAFNVSGYKITPVDNMYAYYMYHIAEIMPYCYLSYHLDCDLKKATGRQIRMVMDATGECFDYLKDQRIPVMPPGEDSYYAGGAKKKAMHMLYSVMSKTVLGKLMVSDHCENGIREMKYLDELFEELAGAFS